MRRAVFLFSNADKLARQLGVIVIQLRFNSLLALNVHVCMWKCFLNRSSFDLTFINTNPLLLPDWPRGEKEQKQKPCLHSESWWHVSDKRVSFINALIPIPGKDGVPPQHLSSL